MGFLLWWTTERRPDGPWREKPGGCEALRACVCVCDGTVLSVHVLEHKFVAFVHSLTYSTVLTSVGEDRRRCRQTQTASRHVMSCHVMFAAAAAASFFILKLSVFACVCPWRLLRQMAALVSQLNCVRKALIDICGRGFFLPQQIFS